jgi:hypothetical protein
MTDQTRVNYILESLRLTEQKVENGVFIQSPVITGDNRQQLLDELTELLKKPSTENNG